MSVEITAHTGSSVGLAAALQSLVGSIRTGLKAATSAGPLSYRSVAKCTARVRGSSWAPRRMNSSASSGVPNTAPSYG